MIVRDLKRAPQYLDTIADRIWHAWWAADGHELSAVTEALRAVTDAEAFPFTLVATEGQRFVGTVTVIRSDISDRPDLGPCIAALWTEPEARGQGIAQMLVDAALSRLSALHFACAYLAAKPRMHDFYATRGWTLIERDVGRDQLDIFHRALP